MRPRLSHRLAAMALAGLVVTVLAGASFAAPPATAVQNLTVSATSLAAGASADYTFDYKTGSPSLQSTLGHKLWARFPAGGYTVSTPYPASNVELSYRAGGGGSYSAPANPASVTAFTESGWLIIQSALPPDIPANAYVMVKYKGLINPSTAGTYSLGAWTSNDTAVAQVNVSITAPVAVTGVSVSPKTLSLVAGGATGTLTATVTPADATNESVTWSSSDTGVATVSDGVVTPVAAGTATITVTTVDGPFEDTCAVTVTAAPVAVTGVSVSPKTLSLTAGGGTGTLTATVTPADATNESVTWNSSDTDVATVSDGVVTPVAAGTATITVTTVDGSHEDTCEVTVAAAPAAVAVTGVTVSPKALNLTVGGAAGALTATVSPSDATDKTVSWSSGNTSVATVSAGVVTPVAAGTATITATTADGGFTDTCSVTVSTPPPATVYVAGVALVPAELTLTAGGAAGTLVAVVSPADAWNKSVWWQSSDPAVAGVSGGVVAPLAAGTAVISATTYDGGYTAQAAVTVLPPGQIPLGSPSDVLGHPDEEHILRMLGLGVFDLFSDGTFRPNGLVTREHFVMMLWVAAGNSPSDTIPLTFVDSLLVSAWARPYVAPAAQQRVIRGVGHNTLAPLWLVTRAQALTMLARVLGVGEAGAPTVFDDDADIPGWARSSINLCLAQGIVTLDDYTSLAPYLPATRAELARFLSRFLDCKE